MNGKIIMRKVFFAFVIAALISFIGGCDKGIEPEPASNTPPGVTGFSGTVTFVGSWPAGIKRTHLVVFKNLLKDSSDFFPPNLSFVIDSIPNGSRNFSYNSVDNNFISFFKIAPGNYKYVVVAQSKTPAISLDRKDWFIVGVYCIGNNQSQPATMTIQDGKMTTGVDVKVDFNNPPPQPPGG